MSKKFVLIGSERVGKTSFVSRFLFNYFPEASDENNMDRH